MIKMNSKEDVSAHFFYVFFGVAIRYHWCKKKLLYFYKDSDFYHLLQKRKKSG